MKAKLPNWEGMWPAFWMLGANIDDINKMDINIIFNLLIW